MPIKSTINDNNDASQLLLVSYAKVAWRFGVVVTQRVGFDQRTWSGPVGPLSGTVDGRPSVG